MQMRERVFFAWILVFLNFFSNNINHFLYLNDMSFHISFHNQHFRFLIWKWIRNFALSLKIVLLAFLFLSSAKHVSNGLYAFELEKFEVQKFFSNWTFKCTKSVSTIVRKCISTQYHWKVLSANVFSNVLFRLFQGIFLFYSFVAY